jgi:hypothetical protein
MTILSSTFGGKRYTPGELGGREHAAELQIGARLEVRHWNDP